ncbi:hypothetical protein AXA44_45680 [Rhodococcus sp. SC4]|nr:hypothetical protein AXA44_45680 [Rhodococcus sp. SC4]
MALPLAAVVGCSGSSTGSAGGGFTVASLEPDHLTPGRTASAFEPIHALFAPLTNFGNDAELEYVQAQSVTSDDNRTWMISLRPGWTFHNGEEVTADNFAKAWNATAYGPNAWANNGQLAIIDGYAALNPADGDPTSTELSGVSVVDPYTLRVTLVEPDSQFPYKLSQPGFFPLPDVAFDDFDAYDEEPIGNGPFRMDEPWQHDVSVSMSRYDDYAGDPAKSQHVTFQIYSDMTTAYTDVQAGAVDITFVAQQKFKQAKNDFGDRLVTFDAVRVDFLGFPLWDQRFQDPRIRKAISMAVDRDAINDAILGGLYRPATSLTPKTAIGGGTEGTCGQDCEFDPEQARKLLAEAGGWDGPMELWFPTGVGYDQTYEAIGNQLRQNLGIEEVKLASQPGFTQFLAAVDQRKATGPFTGGWGSLYPSMQNLLTAVFTPTGEGSSSSGWYESPTVDQLLATGNLAPTPEAAVTAYKGAEQQILTDFPVVPLFFAKYARVHSENVSNVTIGFDEVELADVEVR